MKAWHIAVATAALFGQTNAALAATLFWPNVGEWASWPEYCRAKYTFLRIDETLEFGPTMPKAALEQQKATLGQAWEYIHHHCAGLSYLQRAKSARTADERKFALRQAMEESRFTYARVKPDLPIYAEIATHMGSIARTSGDQELALQYYGVAMTTHPQFPGGYEGTALVLQDQHKNDAALEVLLQGNEATGGDSPEIHYFLGLAYLNLKDLDLASEHARRAYDLGYPLPGLRNKLAAAGRPIG